MLQTVIPRIIYALTTLVTEKGSSRKEARASCLVPVRALSVSGVSDLLAVSPVYRHTVYSLCIATHLVW